MASLLSRLPLPRSRPLAPLGGDVVARLQPARARVPDGCFLVHADGAPAPPGRAAPCWAVHPGPYACTIAPFAQAPELGLRLWLAVDATPPAPQADAFARQLAACGGTELTAQALAAGCEAALAEALRTGALALPPCAQLDEWQAFRRGLDRLLFTRFGLMVDDCLPADLSGERDYAAMLAQRLTPPTPPPVSTAPPDARRPARALPAALTAPLRATAAAPQDSGRRLFIELPRLTATLRCRLVTSGAGTHAERAAVLQRLDLLRSGLGGPGQPRRRAARAAVVGGAPAARAAAALDAAWAWLAQPEQGTPAALLAQAQALATALERASADAGEGVR